MFDWNDEELANIIWDEAGNSEDHIVPYPEGREERPLVIFCNDKKKKWDQEAANIKPTGQKKSIAKTDLHGSKLESSSHFDTNEGLSASGLGMDTWPDFSLSNAAKTDQDSMAETARLDDGPETFQNQHEDREQGDFVDYGWANIGSFDDFDRFFSNDGPIFGHVSHGNAEELWSSSKDVTNIPVKSFPLFVDSSSSGLGALKNISEHFEIKREYVQDEDQSFTPSYGKMNDPISHALQNVHASVDQEEYAGVKSKPLVKEKTTVDMVGKTTTSNSHLAAENISTPNEFADKVNRQKKPLKCQKKSEEKSKGRRLQDLCGTWSPPGNQCQQFDGRFAPSMVQTCPPSVLSQQRQLLGPEFLRFHHISNPILSPSTYGNFTNQYPAMPMLPQIHSGEDKNQPVFSAYEVSPGNANPLNKSPDSPVKPQTMTPQEKIEKLRRRQQMQALLAIQKQQQQFSNQVSCADHSITQKCPQENKIQLMEGTNLEIEDNLSTFPFLDQNSPIEQDDSSKISMATDDYSVEDTILHQLEDIVAKLDVRIRLCIRDSLFRLAQSAMQRHYASDRSSTNKSSRNEHEVVSKEEINSHNRFARMPDVETETNPIDRTVAHLLFHRPLELSGKHPEMPESPISTKFQCEQKTGALVSLPKGCSPESPKNKQNFSHYGSKSPCPFAEPQYGDHFKNSPCIDTSENASNNEPEDGRVMEIETSQ